MTREDIIRMARGAKWGISKGRWLIPTEELERFAALVAEHERAAEREACAEICDAEATIEGIAQRCAANIRARGSK
jgi:hypothetical protein